ncbi:hypothetical protein TCAL_05727 [Tigriopus californicus]|uniref:Uncharacterized protein n=2 Tax=Tigriopus californicus TaxID=6832 RepID=A0A553N9K4_TIGCA|nr:uncharacterized protein LOC131884684 isoform X1 [Tigriopus californicus]XP_059088511.1 uncharacterized protein LOC131884684 isoform X1 [Tigriopus californicus]XP_059088512.1 uncharacterized protein LOC131884684 isoform X1 [Tigriopus californicus]XP_059088513.1 uncharacterized protein LOC131884684 isoform X1 [Tigriopus californicus]XP_059088514.1 uncharacterized protein LOC131884684 isoform X1 [Tigriopus californicus]TRY62065.1 hypothetical protein TCAL_05727 [Tigriopus californicus]|eukprot:TCALIF_05727-PA protein Name:"Protein of unknown function" AED:0.00 eAED:0.00 QI:426/1/1/1/0/0.33/3/88/245
MASKLPSQSCIKHLQSNPQSIMGNILGFFKDQKTMENIPTDLIDLLQDHNQTTWVPDFRSFLTSLDERTKQHWRASLLDFVLLARSIRALQAKQEQLHFDLYGGEENQSPQKRARSDNKANKKGKKKSKQQKKTAEEEEDHLINEHNRLFEQMERVFLGEESQGPIALSDSVLRSRLAFEVHEEKNRTSLKPIYEDYKKDNIFHLVWQAHNDPLVWTKLEKLCDKYLKQKAQSAISPIAVLLSIL